MSPEVQRIFREIADLDPTERERRLEAISLSDADREEILELLRFDRTDRSEWSDAVSSVAGKAFGAEAWIGATVGAYRLERLLGQGGMGAVYLGERSDGEVRHRAAIKLINHLKPDLVQRFLRERQILASLSNPNIAQLLDAGTVGGIPYFAMEYCDGESVDEYCARNELGPNSVLKLFLPVCEAVHYAHQRMIVHRDLKPSNIMVTADGVPKLLDFGIAKELSNSEETQTVARVMTFHFASPEQIRGEPVSAVSDVYSLGAVLYRLLTGHLPREKTTGVDSSAESLDAQPLRLTYWRPGLDADIENIVLMALRPEPEKRYASAEALAEDIRLFLHDQPIHATPPSLPYRLNRFLRRNPAAAFAAVVAVASLLGGTAFSLYEARRARQNLADGRQMANVFLFEFERSIRDIPGTLAARHKVIDTARRYLEKIAPEAKNDPTLLREIADAYRNLAEVQYSADVSREGAQAAVQSLQKSLEIRRSLGDPDSGDPNLLSTYIATSNTLCSRSIFVGQMAVARATCLEAGQLAGKWVEREPRNVTALEAAQSAAAQSGAYLEADGRAGEAVAMLEAATRHAERLLQTAPANADLQARLARASRLYSNMLVTVKRPLEATAPAEKAVAIYEGLLAPDPRNKRWRANVVVAYLTAGSAHLAAAAEDSAKAKVHTARAAGRLEQGVETARATVSIDPADVQAQDNLVVAAHRLARLREQERRYRDALDLYAAARRTVSQRIEKDPARRNLYLMGNNLLNAGRVLQLAGSPAASARTLEESVAWLRRSLDLESSDAVVQENLVSAYYHLASAAEKRRDPGKARERWQLAWQEAGKMIRRDPSAKSYIGDYRNLEEMGRRLGEWKP